MTRRIPQNFRQSSEAAIASFSFTEVVTGTGYITFYPIDLEDATLALTSNVMYGQTVSAAVLDWGGTGNVEPVIDNDYDIEFDLPQIIDGKLFANIPMAMKGTTGGEMTSSIKLQVRKWDGTTETDLASADGEEFAITLALNEEWFFMNGFVIDVPRTHFKKGESLRFTIEYWSRSTAGGGRADIWYGRDPQGRNTTDEETPTWAAATDVPSTSKVFVPFRIDR